MDNKDQIQGKVEHAQGTVKEGVGNAIDDPKMQQEGSLDKAKGDVRKGMGDVREGVDKVADDLKR